MTDTKTCVGGDGGPLILLQASAVPQWQGASDFENSLMEGGDVETDYDVICDSKDGEDIFVVARYDHEMLVVWDSEFGGSFLSPELLSLSPDTLILSVCYHPTELPGILPNIVERVQKGQPERSILFNIQDTSLRLQVGADSSIPSYSYNYIDIAISSGLKRCDVYLIEHNSLRDEVVIINAHEPN